MCTFVARNGKPSMLFDTLARKVDFSAAVSNYLNTKSISFKNWYGNGSLDENGEPLLKDNIFVNDKGEVRNLTTFLSDTTIEEGLDVVNKLTNIFKQNGVDVKVKYDPSADYDGLTIGTESGAEISLRRPDTLSTYHEFGHIYVDMIGYNTEIIQEGIRRLRGTEIWEKVERSNPALFGERLEKEVLVTAIAVSAQNKHSYLAKYGGNKSGSILAGLDSFLAWLGTLWRRIADLLGVNTDVAERLAYDLTGGKLRHRLTHKVSTYEQYKKITVEDLVNIGDQLELSPDEKKYVHKNTKEEYERTTTLLELLTGAFNRETALRQSVLSKSPLYEDFTEPEQIARLWADTREESSGIHKIMEDYAKGRNNGISTEELREKILSNLRKPEYQKDVDDDEVRFYSGMKREYVETYIDRLFGFIDDLLSRGYKLYPEIKVYHKDVGVAGTIDLLAVSPEGKIVIFDFKTKRKVTRDGEEESKFDKWNSINIESATFLPKSFSHIANTTGNRYSAQTSMYKMILSLYGLEVSDMYVVPLVGEVTEENGEFYYTNVDFYKSSNASNFVKDEFPTELFKLEDYSDIIKGLVYDKESIEQEIQTIDNSKKEGLELLEQISEIEGIAEWKREVIYDIERTIKHLWSVKSKARAEAYQTSARSLIEKLLVTDEAEAIANYTKYIGKTLFEVHQKLHGKIVVTERNKLGTATAAKILKGYATMTWEDIKELERTDKTAYLEFVSFLINGTHFVKQAMKIKEINFSSLIDLDKLTDEERDVLNESLTVTAAMITSSKPEERLDVYYDFVSKIKGKYSTVIERLKSFEGKISDIEVSFERLRKELSMRFPELTSNPLFKGKEVTEIYEAFFKNQFDETFMQANMDALGDTHVGFVANVVKHYDQRMFSARQESKDLITEFFEKTDGIDLSKFVDENTGKLHTKTDQQKYILARERAFRNAAKIKDSKKKATALNKWFKQNTVLLEKDKRDAIIKERKRNLSKEDFKEWEARQYYYGSNNIRYIKNTSVFYVPNEKYLSTAYSEFSEKDIEAIEYLRDLLMYLTDHVKDSIISDGFIPAIPESDKTLMSILKQNFSLGKERFDPMEVDVDEDGNLVNTLPLRFIHLMNQQPLKPIPEGASEQVRRELYKENEQIKRDNYAAHAAAINKDLSKVIPIFIEVAVRHRWKKHMEFELQSAYKEFSDNLKLSRTSNGMPLLDRVKVRFADTNPAVQVSTTGSRIDKHFQDWLKMVFYEDATIDEGLLTRIAAILQNYTSFKGLALNPLSAINNQMYGGLMTSIEGLAGEFFTVSDLKNATAEYATSIASFFTDNPDKGKFSSKASAFLGKFDNVFMDYRELSNNISESSTPAAKAAYKFGKILGKAYFLQHISEHNLQGRLTLAMIKHHRIVNGKIMSLNDYLYDPSIKFDPYKTKAKVKDIKEKTKLAAIEWKKFPTVWDAFDFDKKLVLKEGIVIDDTALANFERRMLGVNQYVHGIYNKEDAGAVQQYALGRMAIQFRKWMRPGWNKRWGNRMFEDYWNERRARRDEGYYTTTIKFLASPIFRHFKNKKESKEYRDTTTTLQAFKNIFKDYGRFIGNIRVHWHSLTDTEKGNVIRTMVEYLALCSAVALYYALKGLKGDDDEPPKALMLALYQTDRTIIELTQFVPVAVTPGFVGGGWMNETKKILKSPTATFNVIDNAFDLGKTLIMYPFNTEEENTYQTGTYYGQDKLKVNTIKMIPIINQIYRWENLDRNYKFYKLF